MRIKSAQYAASLYESAKGKEKSEIRKIVKNFAFVLKENNDIHKAKDIIKDFSVVWNKKNGIAEAALASAGEITQKERKGIEEHVKRSVKAEKINIKSELDKNLLGGFVLVYEDKVIDASLRSRLSSLKEALKK